ncbi:MAG: hypothetical protein KY428_02940, partial [Bacteroidetes bacterium]|nr:hypothetical protein [Bacteroidota bacterium]
MARTFIVGVDEFEFPDQGDSPDWGEQITDWAEAVTDALKNVQQPNDILTTQASIANNQTTAASITGFSFDTSEVLAVNAEYIVIRKTVSPATNLVESGIIEGNFDGTNWSITRKHIGDAGIVFTITAGGQIQYTSSNISGTSYTGEVSFKAKVFNQA